MKYIYLLLISFLVFNTYGQTYNINLNPSLGVGGETNVVPPGETFYAGTRVENLSTAAVTAINFYWYLSTDSVYGANDPLIYSDNITSGSLLQPNGWSDLGTRMAVLPDGYTPGCNYFIIMRAAISQTETVYTDNFSFGRICIRDKRIDLKATSVTPDAGTYYRGINNTNTVVSAVVTNDGELPASSTITYDLKLGTSADPAVGNISSVRKTLPSLAAKTSSTVSQTFNIAALAAGTYYLFLQVDPDNVINDPVRTNNLVMQTFKIANLDSLNGQDVLMPTGTDSRYVATCGATIYDNGGSAGDYLPNTNSTLYLYPGEANKKIRVKVSQYNFNGADYMRIYYYASPFIGYQYLTVTNTSTFPIEFIPPAADGRVYITQYSDATTQASGAKIEISCAPAVEYQTIISATSKPTYIAPVDEIAFTAGIKNRGYNTLTSLNYTYGLSATASQNNVIYESAVNTIAQINVNSSAAIPATNKIALGNIPVTAGTYYVFVRGINADDATQDNISYYPINIVLTDTVKNVSVNFQNNKTQYFTSCNMTLYDDGGAAGNYSNNFSGKVTILPDAPDKIVKLVLTYNLETQSNTLKDILTIYDGLTNVKKLTLPATTQPVYYTDGSATIDFTSDAITTMAGFKISVGCAYKGVDYKNQTVDASVDTLIYGMEKAFWMSSAAIKNGSVNGLPQYTPLMYKVYISPTTSKANAIYTSALSSYSLDNISNAYTSGNFILDISTMAAIASSGKYYIITEVDPTNMIAEVDETNNILMDSMYIKVLPAGELRLPGDGTYTVTACNSKVYGYSGAERSTAIATGAQPVLKIIPADATSKLKFVVNSYTANYGNVQIAVYERSVNANSPVATFTIASVFPISYTAVNVNSPLEIRITYFTSTGIRYKLDANIVCIGAFDFALSNNVINENVPANSLIGAFSTQNAVPTDVFTYDFVTGTGDADNGSFVFAGNELHIKNTPDFETKNNYAIRVRAKNQKGAVIEKAFTVTVNDLNEVPVDFVLSTSSIDENVPANSLVGTLNALNAQPTDVFICDFTTGTGDADNASFVLSGNELRIKNSPDFETKNSYTIRVQGKNQNNLVTEKIFTITINDLNEVPVDFVLSTSSIDENVPANSLVGTLSALNAQPTDVFICDFATGTGDADNASFVLSGNELHIVNSPDFEIKNTYSIRVQGKNQNNIVTEKTFTIMINDLNEVPVDLALSTSSTNENVPANSLIGMLSALNAAPADVYTYDLVAGTGDADNGFFVLTGNELHIVNSPDFEVQNTYSIRVQGKNQNNIVTEKTFTITINDLNEVPVDLALSTSSTNENVPANSLIGTLSALNAAPADVYTYDLVAGADDADNSSFVLAGNELHIANSPDFEIKNSYSIRVQGKNQNNLVTEKVFVITISDLNEAPVDIALSAYSITENVSANTVVGTFTTTDPDAANTFTYELTSGTGDIDNTLFVINGNELVLLVSPDYETKNRYSLLVKSSDQDGLSVVKAIVVSVMDQNEIPSIADQSYSIDEDQALGTHVGTVVGITDSGEELTYSIVSGNESGAFAIDAATGDITVAAALDYNTTQTYILEVQVTDNSSSLLNATATITVNINQVVSASIHNARSSNGINIYPNPSSDKVTIDVLDASISIQTITLINALGEVVSVEPYSKNMDLSGLPGGLYTLLLNGSDISYTKQLIVY